MSLIKLEIDQLCCIDLSVEKCCILDAPLGEAGQKSPLSSIRGDSSRGIRPVQLGVHPCIFRTLASLQHSATARVLSSVQLQHFFLSRTLLSNINAIAASSGSQHHHCRHWTSSPTTSVAGKLIFFFFLQPFWYFLIACSYLL